MYINKIIFIEYYTCIIRENLCVKDIRTDYVIHTRMIVGYFSGKKPALVEYLLKSFLFP